jgi:hypothetical protein
METVKAVRTPPATYVNFLRIAQSSGEIFLAFGQANADSGPDAQLVASLVTSPVHAKAMLRALAQSIALHESRFGVIPEPAEPGLRVATGSRG